MREDDDESDKDTDTARPHWHEFGTGFMGELGSVLSRTLFAFMLGVLIAAIITIVSGIVFGDGSVSEVLISNGIPGDTVDAIRETADQLARMSLALLLGLGFLVPGLVALGHCLRDTAISRAVREAADSGAPRTSVPNPDQVAGITRGRFDHLWWYLYFGFPIPAFVLILLVLLVSREAPLLALVSAIVLIAVGVGYHRLRTSVEPEHLRRRRSIGKHWRLADERAVWDRAVASEAPTPRGATPTSCGMRWARDRRVSIGRRVTLGALALGCFGCHAVYMIFLFLYPEANRYVRETGPRADYPPEIDHLVGVALIIVGAVLAFSLVAAIVGVVLETRGRRSELAALQAIIDAPATQRPPRAALLDYGFRQPARGAQAMAVVAAMAVAFGTATVILGTLPFEDFPGAVESFREYVLPAAIVALAGAVLLATACTLNAVKSIRDRDMRNRITARWPTAPTRTTDFRGHEVPALNGPELSLLGDRHGGP